MAENYLQTLTDVRFINGAHMVAWADALDRTIGVFETLMASVMADVKSGLAHQRWKVLKGELPPRLRAQKVVMPLRIGLVALKGARLGVREYQRQLENRVRRPAMARARDRARNAGRGAVT